MMTDFDPNLVVVGVDLVPTPSLAAVVQVGNYVKVIVVAPPITGTQQLVSLRLYRAPSAPGPWANVDAGLISPISVHNNLFDTNPGIGHMNYYAASAVNSLGTESSRSAVLSIAPHAP